MTAPLTPSRINEISGNPACATEEEVRALCGMALGASEVVGHKTFSDGRGGFRHEPLTRTEAEQILAAADAAKAERAARYPTAEDAASGLWHAWYRLKELGWREAIYAPPTKKLQRVIEIGSSGIHSAWCEPHPERDRENWWWSPSEGDVWPMSPILYFDAALATQER